MYSGPLLKSGNLRDYTPLGEIGQPVYDAADQIRTAVLHQIGRDAADLFAVPKFDSVGRNIDWYATQDGDIVPWDAASPEERDTARRRLLELNDKIESHARRIIANPQSNDQLVFGRLLALCPFIPDSSHIFIIKGQPVLTFWGFVPAGADPSRHRLADIVKQEPIARPAVAAPIAPAAAAAAAVAPVAAAAGWWRWLWWLLGLLLLLLILLMALRSCDVIEAPVPYITNEGIVWPDETPPDNTIVTVPGGTVNGGTVTGTGTIDGTTNGTVVVPDGTVDPNAPVTPDATLPGTTPEQPTAPDQGEQPNADQNTPPDAPTPEDQQKQDQQNPDQQNPGQQNPDQPKTDAQTPPDAQQPDQQQKPGDTPQDQQAGAQPPIKPIELPAGGSAASGPADFMQGQWRSQTGLRTTGSNAPATIGYQFDKQGKGTTTLNLGNGVTCSGASAATTQNGKLTIQDQGGLNCSDGSNFQGSTVECSKAADGKTHCVGRYPNGQTYDILLGQ
jgi:outer membrane biosynthesis protein TonB